MRGDIAVFENSNAKRQDFENRDALRLTVFPGDVYLTESPERGVQFGFFLPADFDSCLDDGWNFVSAGDSGDFTSKRYPVGADGKVTAGNPAHTLMYRDEETYLRAKARQHSLVDNRVNANYEALASQAEAIGVGYEEERGGAKRVKSSPKASLRS